MCTCLMKPMCIYIASNKCLHCKTDCKKKFSPLNHGLNLIAFAVTKYWKHDKINTVNRSWKRNNIDPYLIPIVPHIFTW